MDHGIEHRVERAEGFDLISRDEDRANSPVGVGSTIQSSYRVLVIRFGIHTDPDVPYMFHCHLLAHEDRGMMGQFVVVAPGESAGHPAMAGHDHD